MRTLLPENLNEVHLLYIWIWLTGQRISNNWLAFQIADVPSTKESKCLLLTDNKWINTITLLRWVTLTKLYDLNCYTGQHKCHFFYLCKPNSAEFMTKQTTVNNSAYIFLCLKATLILIASEILLALKHTDELEFVLESIMFPLSQIYYAMFCFFSFMSQATMPQFSEAPFQIA